ncbi:NADH-quinone oxidoreductase subunit F [Candidatus Woesearchaeota archaeon]|nr:NADH-quinone oxidoreductase subunit F [Candidatus Woesearchaeota archaeon]
MQILRKPLQRAYRKAIKLGSKATIDLIKKKGLSGRGGANFPTGSKWEMVSKEKDSEKYLICNADEGEPGTFKDKFIIEKNPEALIEGILIAAYAIKAKKAFIYLRGEYDYLESKLKKAITKIKNRTGSETPIEIVIGAGAYICGDETAILESIEGKRGQARTKPPFPTVRGLYSKPTVINNVETLANVPLAMLYDDWNKNLRLYSLSGNVTRPGVYELPLGTPLCDLIKLGRPKNPIKAVFFGCFGGCIPHCDIPLHPDAICGKECMLGSCTIIAVDEKQSIVDLVTNIAKFYEFESCGKCTPCREGTYRILNILENISMKNADMKDLDTLKELAEVIKETSFCGLGQTSTNHLLNALKYFRSEFEERVKEKKTRKRTAR